MLGCPKRYTDPSSLRKHVKSHTTEEQQQYRRAKDQINAAKAQQLQQQQQQQQQQQPMSDCEGMLEGMLPIEEKTEEEEAKHSASTLLAVGLQAGGTLVDLAEEERRGMEPLQIDATTLSTHTTIPAGPGVQQQQHSVNMHHHGQRAGPAAAHMDQQMLTEQDLANLRDQIGRDTHAEARGGGGGGMMLLPHQPNSLDDLDPTADSLPFDDIPVRYDESGRAERQQQATGEGTFKLLRYTLYIPYLAIELSPSTSSICSANGP